MVFFRLLTIPEEGRSRSQDHLVGGEGGAAAAGERHVGEVLAAEHVPREAGELAAVVAPLQPQLIGRVCHREKLSSRSPVVWKKCMSGSVSYLLYEFVVLQLSDVNPSWLEAITKRIFDWICLM